MMDTMAWLSGDVEFNSSAGNESGVLDDSFADDPQVLAQVLEESQVICLLEMARYKRPYQELVAISRPNSFLVAYRSLIGLAAAVVIGCGIWWYLSVDSVGSLVAWNFHLESGLLEGLPNDESGFSLDDSRVEMALDADDGESLLAMRDEPLSWISAAIWEAEGSLE